MNHGLRLLVVASGSPNAFLDRLRQHKQMPSASNKSSTAPPAAIPMIAPRGRCDDDPFDVPEGEGVLGAGVPGAGGGGNVRRFPPTLREKQGLCQKSGMPAPGDSSEIKSLQLSLYMPKI